MSQQPREADPPRPIRQGCLHPDRGSQGSWRSSLPTSKAGRSSPHATHCVCVCGGGLEEPASPAGLNLASTSYGPNLLSHSSHCFSSMRLVDAYWAKKKKKKENTAHPATRLSWCTRGIFQALSGEPNTVWMHITLFC